MSAPERSPATLTATQTKLVLAALSLFAKHGIESVSLRQITQAAEQSNESAVHYHFGGKAGLVTATLEYINAQLAPMQATSMAELEDIARLRTPTVRETISHAVMPFVAFYAQSSTGRKALRFLSRLIWQSQEQELSLLIAKFWPYYTRIEHYLIEALPHKPKPALRLHGILAATNLLHNLADTRILRSQVTLGIGPLLADRPDVLIDYFIDYMVGGITAETTPH